MTVVCKTIPTLRQTIQTSLSARIPTHPGPERQEKPSLVNFYPHKERRRAMTEQQTSSPTYLPKGPTSEAEKRVCFADGNSAKPPTGAGAQPSQARRKRDLDADGWSERESRTLVCLEPEAREEEGRRKGSSAPGE